MSSMSNLKNWFLCITIWVFSTLLVLLLITAGSYQDLETIIGRRQIIETPLQNIPEIPEFNSVTDVPFDQNHEDLSNKPDKSPFATDSNISSIGEVPNLPVAFLLQQNPKKSFNNTCANLPELFDIKMNNVHWQHFQINGGKNIYFYAAYYDIRSSMQNSATGATVRLLAMTDMPFNSQPKTLCQFWFKDQASPSFSAEATFKYIWNTQWGYHNGILVPILISCPIVDAKSKPPSVVSFVKQKCDNPTNALRVQHSELFANAAKPNKTPTAHSASIAVCVKGLTFLHEDKSVRIIEWLELLKIVGVQQVFMYNLALHPQTQATLKHYQKSGFVDVTNLNLPGEQMNTPDLIALYFKKKITPKRLNELIPYQDCLYRNLYRYDYIALLDIDEIILPRRRNILTWKEMLEETISSTDQPPKRTSKIGDITRELPKYSSICARNVYFFDNFTSKNTPEIPSYLHMLNHVVRAYNYTKPGHYVKCIHAVDQILTLHNHFPMHCLTRCRSRSFDLSLGHMQHYRDGCVKDIAKTCSSDYMNHTIIDTTIWKYKDKLVKNSNDVLRELGYL